MACIFTLSSEHVFSRSWLYKVNKFEGRVLNYSKSLGDVAM